MLQIQPYSLEFHISRQARDFYQFDDAIFTFNGNVIFPNFNAARLFAQKMNAKRDLVQHPEQAVKAGQVNAMGLIDEILHLVVENYRQQVNPWVIREALEYLEQQFSKVEIDRALRLFVDEFPTVDLYRHNQEIDAYLLGSSQRPDGSLVENRQIVLEEMLMLWLANMNPAFSPFSELFDDSKLRENTLFLPLIESLHAYFDDQPGFGPSGQNLIDLLRSPALHAPDSLVAQLEFVRGRWGGFLGEILLRILTSLDLVKEEEKPIFAFGGPGPSYVYEFSGIQAEPENFSPDLDWMPNLFLLAKNSYVWLDQLSKKYQRPITQLDQVPESELHEMARWGITGLWLIGLWERSKASQKIKQLRGNPEAVASAYSLLSYDIATDLGGDQAYQVLRDKAWKFGIRLASDMVPNHMGIDSRWLIEHPDWFISLNYSPFPSYTFNGPNLSWDSRVGIYLEDHYYNNSDAAVVFKRVDFWTGSEKFIYHGNDGTSMPWNDTAQLNYLLPEVREAVIQTILHVARKFPIIRFDAAMTLAKKHYQRLWFPEPGSGGDIPSRAEYGLTKPAFDEAFPEEFWREVVDRVQQEVPDTLLLAEAFWMMEGYFVRTLGMHRVYNSAFMNMLRDEKNQEYRLLIKNTLEFEPEILKRYVNFMNNPDERTAVDQFGKGDKYFGVCTMMATMPGLPMFGHGQVEGFTEKYGMEYRKAYWDETIDNDLVERHKRQVFPLARHRYLFAPVENFSLYDFESSDGYVVEDVFAYSNQAGDQRTLVVYHNKFASANGWVRNSTGYLKKVGPGPDDRQLSFHSLGEGLALHDEAGYYTTFRDHISQLEFLRSSQELCQKGLYMELGAYNCHVFMNFREVQDTPDHQYAQLAAYLQGGGVPSVEEAMKERLLQPIHVPFRELVNPGMLNWLIEHRLAIETITLYEESLEIALDELDKKSSDLLQAIDDFSSDASKNTQVLLGIRKHVRASLEFLESRNETKKSTGLNQKLAQELLFTKDQRDLLESGSPRMWDILLTWSVLGQLGKMAELENYAEQSRLWMDEWLLGKQVLKVFQQRVQEGELAERQLDLLKILVKQANWCQNLDQEAPAQQLLSELLQDEAVLRYLLVNKYQDTLYFNKEAFETLMKWLAFIMVISARSQVYADQEPKVEVKTKGKRKSPARKTAETSDLVVCSEVIEQLLQAMQKSEYQLGKLQDLVGLRA